MIWWLRYSAGFALLCAWDLTDWFWLHRLAMRVVPRDVFGEGERCGEGAPF